VHVRVRSVCIRRSVEKVSSTKPVASEASLDFSDLRACFVNCTLKPSPTLSHTQGLMDKSAAIMRKHGVAVDQFRAVDFDIAPGVYPDMREDVVGGEQASDAWPDLAPRVLDADILVVGTPIWLGDKSSVATRVVERLYALSGETNDRGQYLFYGRTAGVLVTGNEDGIKHIGMNLLYSLQHIGYAIPPNADAGWIGPAGPGPSYLDEDSGGPENEFTQRNTTFMTWNLMHMAAWLKRGGGFPAGGNSRELWDAGERFDYPTLD
jgi:multimeric flavodoxin WrbA